MAKRYGVEGAGRAAVVASLFDSIATRYDLVNDLQSFGMHRRWKRRLVEIAEVRRGEPALDACCGTGDIAMALAGAGARVTGMDFSRSMLAEAARRPVPGDAIPPQFVIGDALSMPFDDGSFDLVTIAYGLRNLADLDRGLGELWRVLRPGGRLAALEFGAPKSALARRLWFWHLGWVIPWYGRLFAGNAAAYAYILDSLLCYPDADAVAMRLSRLGFERIRVFSILGGVMSIHRADKSPRL